MYILCIYFISVFLFFLLICVFIENPIQFYKMAVAFRDICCDGLYYEPDVRTERATFAMSCFWGPEAIFGCTPGVVRTRVGYAGLGTVANPSYKNIFDYTETVDVEFDPLLTNFDKMIEIFWKNHDPTVACSRQVDGFLV